MRDEKLIVKCPFCGAEYLPAELYFPEDFLPKTIDVLRDGDEKIIAYTGDVMNLVTEYCCDKCNHVFKVTTDVIFNSEKCNEHDFNNDFTEPLFNNNRTELKED